MKLLAVPVGGLLLLGVALTAGRGEAAAPVAPPAFNGCLACHKVSADGAISVGPNLRGIVGRKAAAQVKYAYSPALKKAGFVWTRENLDRWLAGPQKMVPGTKMVQSVPNAANRKAVIDYLVTLK